MALPSVRATITVGTVVRLGFAATTGLGIDESYAVAVNRPLSWSYFDHPPLVFWLSAAAEAISGSRHPLVVRLPFVLCFSVTLLALAWLTRRLFGDAAARGAVLAASAAGVIGVTGGTWVLPDGPLFMGLMIAGSGAAMALLPAADGSSRTDARGWWLVGLGAGLAALAKYHAIFLPLGLLVFIVLTRRTVVLRTWAPWAAAVVAALLSAPVFVWNARHAWASFRFQSARAAPVGAWTPAPLLENVAGQALWILPWVWIPAVWVLWRAARRGPRDERSWFCLCLAAGPLLAFTGSALLGRRGLPHWQAPGYLMLMPLVGAAVADALARGRAWARVWVNGAPVVTALTAVVLATQTATGWMSLPPSRDPTRDAVPWDDATSGLRDANAIEATHWMDGAKLGAALGHAAPLRVLATDARHFAFRVTGSTGANAIVVRSASRGPLPRELQDQLGPLDTTARVPVTRRGIAVDTLFVFQRAQRPGR